MPVNLLRIEQVSQPLSDYFQLRVYPFELRGGEVHRQIMSGRSLSERYPKLPLKPGKEASIAKIITVATGGQL